MTAKNMNVWDAFLELHHNGKLSSGYWESAPEFQEELANYLKSLIDSGVSDGKTSFPYDLSYYLWQLPKGIVQHLKLYAENILNSDPDNGAAVHFLAIETFQMTKEEKPFGKYPLLEKAMLLAPKDLEICFYAFSMCTWGGSQWNTAALIAVERLLERLHDCPDKTSYHWLSELYSHYDVLTKPNHYYQESQGNPDLAKRWKIVLTQIATVFKGRLVEIPNSGTAMIGLADIYETMGNIEDAQAVFNKRLEQNENDADALDGLANILEKLGDTELARKHKIKARPSLKWVGQSLADFPSGAADLGGKLISLADYRGKVVLLDFWAVWCGPCVGEIPDIKKVYEKYHDKGFEVIGVSFDEDDAMLREFLKEKDIPWQNIMDNEGFRGRFAKQYGIRGIPSPFLIDRHGKVISVNARGRVLDELVAAEIG